MRLLLLQALVTLMCLMMALVPLIYSLQAAMVLCEQDHSHQTCLEVIGR